MKKKILKKENNKFRIDEEGILKFEQIIWVPLVREWKEIFLERLIDISTQFTHAVQRCISIFVNIFGGLV